MTTGLVGAGIAALIAALGAWPAAASPARPEIAVERAITQIDGPPPPRFRAPPYQPLYNDYFYQYSRPYRPYRPDPGFFQPPYNPRYPYPPRYKYLHPPQPDGSGAGSY